MAATWPSIYWNGYNPELFYLKDARNATVAREFDYHARPIFGGYFRGLGVEETAAGYRRYAVPDPAAAAETGHRTMALREQSLDIRVSGLIRARCGEERLFWTFNHPSSSVLLDVARQVLGLLGLPCDLPPALPAESLNSTIFPILDDVRNALGLDFEEPERIRLRGTDLPIPEAVERYFAFYAANPELLELNRKQVEGQG